MASRDVPYHAEWADNMGYRNDPNRVTPARADAADAALVEMPGMSQPPIQYDFKPGEEPTYYDIPMLKAPLWGWEIASYFYFAGISAGTYLLTRIARRQGGRDVDMLVRLGNYISLATLIPCPPLLIHDLGDPKRFHHMLRIWKPSSPMNLGTWTLMAYSGILSADLAQQFLMKSDKQNHNSAFALLRDAAGIPVSLILMSYTGVLLSCTANPLWCRNKWLSPLFVASAISTGAEALSLTLDLASKEDHRETQTALQRIDTAAHVVEGVALSNFMREAGEKAACLETGKQAKFHRFAKVAIIAAECLKLVPLPKRARKPARIAASILGLAGAFAMRWGVIHGGHSAANDPRTSRMISKGKDSHVPRTS